MKSTIDRLLKRLYIIMIDFQQINFNYSQIKRFTK